jgi:hypothetical protein
MKNKLFFSFIFFAKVALATVLPLALFVLPARILDKKLATSPSLTVIGVILALIFTISLIVKVSKIAIKEIQKLD